MTGRIREFNSMGAELKERAPREVLQHATALNSMGQRVDSVNFVRAAIQHYPSDVFLHMNASVTLTKIGDEMERGGNAQAADEYWNLALDYALCGLKENPDDIRLLTQAAKTFRKTKEFEDSEAMYMRAVCLNDRDKFSWSALGELYARWAEQPDEDYDAMCQDAADCYAEALWLDPDDEVAQNKVNDLSSRGYIASPQGYDPGPYDLQDDDALEVIAEHSIVHAEDLPVAPAAPVRPDLRRDNYHAHWRPQA